jgi:macrodomain Ter protein organizer (MatP/YcbG family)
MKKSNSPYSTIAVRHEVHARLKKLAQKRYQSITKLIEQLVELEETREKSAKRRGVFK